MKAHYLILAGFLSFFTTAAQHNFSIVDGKLRWQKVFNIESNATQLYKYLDDTGEFFDLEINTEELDGRFQELTIDYKGAGKSEMFTSMYIARNTWSGVIKIEVKENRYRVTIKNLRSKQAYNDGLSDVGTNLDLEHFALSKKNTAFRKRFLKADAPLFEYTFNKLFSIKEKKKDDW